MIKNVNQIYVALALLHYGYNRHALLLGKGSPKELVMELTDIRQLFCRVIFFSYF